MRMQPDFEKSNEIYFRLGIIYKQQQKYQSSLEVRSSSITVSYENTDQSKCFRYIVSFPPTPLTEEDIWFQIGHVHEQQKDVSVKPQHILTIPSLKLLVRQRESGLQASA